MSAVIDICLGRGITETRGDPESGAGCGVTCALVATVVIKHHEQIRSTWKARLRVRVCNIDWNFDATGWLKNVRLFT